MGNRGERRLHERESGADEFQRRVSKAKTRGGVSLNCFFGQMGVAPAPNLGEISSIQPGPHGGNLDNKDLAPGSVVYFKVNVPGAMFSAGDGHGAQVRFILISVCTGK